MAPKVFAAEKGIGMTEAEALRFLSESTSMIRLGTVDSEGDPNIHPAWFYFDVVSKKLYLFTWKDSKKARNVKMRRRVYFDVDDDRPPYKGVRGKAIARVVPNRAASVSLTQKILAKYIPDSSPLTKSYLTEVEKGDSVVVEVSPLYFSTWDYGKNR